IKRVLAKPTKAPKSVPRAAAPKEVRIRHTCSDDKTDSKSVLSTIVVSDDQTKDVTSSAVKATLSSTIKAKCKNQLSARAKDQNTIKSVDVTKVTKLNGTHSSIEVKTTCQSEKDKDTVKDALQTAVQHADIKRVLAKPTKAPKNVPRTAAPGEVQIQHTCRDDKTDSKSVLSTIVVSDDQTKDVTSSAIKATLSSTIKDKCKSQLSARAKDQNTIKSVDVTKVTKLNRTHSSIEVKTTCQSEKDKDTVKDALQTAVQHADVSSRFHIG
ncbi:unnamed protein product, partial [Didymodactylos carnosus]